MMGPSCGRRTRKSAARRRTHFRKHIQSSKDIEEKSAVSPANSPVKPAADSLQIEGSEDMKARRRTNFKKHIQSSIDIEEKSAVSPANSPVKPAADSLQIEGSEDMKVVDVEMSSSSSCSTPKAERFRIPEIKTCPPAPKKRRIITSCSLQRSTPIAFFNPPDIELFFYLARRGVSA